MSPKSKLASARSRNQAARKTAPSNSGAPASSSSFVEFARHRTICAVNNAYAQKHAGANCATEEKRQIERSESGGDPSEYGHPIPGDTRQLTLPEDEVKEATVVGMKQHPGIQTLAGVEQRHGIEVELNARKSIASLSQSFASALSANSRTPQLINTRNPSRTSDRRDPRSCVHASRKLNPSKGAGSGHAQAKHSP